MNQIGLVIASCFLIFQVSRAQEMNNGSFEQSFELAVQGEFRYFLDEGSFIGQERYFPSVRINPKYSLEWNEGSEGIHFEGIARWDRDAARTHWDIRDLYYLRAKSNWEISIGIKKVFWGTTESAHLVDIINQTDQVESFDGEEKLGQPMVQYSWISPALGTFEFYYLPYHRKRSFNGAAGRFRFQQLLDEDAFDYESPAADWRQDIAVRWKHYFGPVDIGLSHFYGNGREPLFSFDDSGEIDVFYPVINQTGIDLQVTHHAVLWKLESIYRSSNVQDFLALVAGVEYTFGNINGKGLDIGILTEYLYDERGDWSLSGMQNDLFLGSRIAFNDAHDTSILFGGIFDLEQSSTIWAIEATRRVGSDLSLDIEARIFDSIADQELILSNFQNDSFVRIALTQHF